MNFWWPFGADKQTKEQARILLARANDAARDPILFTDGGVPDTIDGRFQLLGLFVALTMRDLNDPKLRQSLFDTTFQFCETGLRELGVGDMGIPYKLKAMFQAFHGHAAQYEAAIADPSLWDEALRRNVYGTSDEVTSEQLQVLKQHISSFSGLSRESRGIVDPRNKSEDDEHGEAA